MDRYDIVIIGAGISGLSLAHYCAGQGLKTLVIEKSKRVGGTLHSHCFSDAGGFWIELGAHTCYNSYRNLIGIMEECGALDRMVPREKVPFKMLIGGNIKSIPSQLDFLELLLSAPRLFTLKKEGQSVESYYSRIAGRKNFERVIAPAMNAVVSQRANDFPADMLFKKRLRRKDIMKKFSMAGGLRTITDAIAAQGNIGIMRGEEAHAVKFSGSLFRITISSATYESDSLALATPPSVAAQLLLEAFPEVSERLSRIRVEAVESIGIAVKKDAVSIAPVAGIIPSSDSFYSAVSRDTVRHDAYRGFTFHFRPGLLDHEAKLRRIAGVLGVERGQLKHVAAKENFVPALKAGHDAVVRAIEQALSGSRLFLTGNYFDGLAIEDCVTRSLKEFQRFLASPGG